MSRKDEIKRLWKEAFDDPAEYVDMYFDRVYRDADALTLAGDDGRTVSSLLLQPYGMTFHGLDATASYIAGAATRRSMRGRGLMSALMATALEASRGRGDIVTILIPASEYLYGYYARFGFVTAAYTDVKRYTALHTFMYPDDVPPEEFAPVDDLFAPAVYDAMASMERSAPQATVLHSHRDYLNILDDLRLDGGQCAAVADSDGNVAAIAFGRPAPDGSDVIRVDSLLASCRQAGDAAMRRLRARWPGKPFAVMAPLTDDGRRPTPRGMARLVNVETALGLIAQAHPELRLTLRVSDPLIADNNGTFGIGAGGVTRVPAGRTGHLDFDVPVTTLTRMLFSSPATGEILGLPAQRLTMALMLD